MEWSVRRPGRNSRKSTAADPIPLHGRSLSTADQARGLQDTLDESYAGTPRTARVARVAASLGTKNTNTLVPPNHGVMWLQLVSKSTGVASKSLGGTQEKDGKEDFHYASSVEEVLLNYQINDPKGVILAAKLEIYRRFETAPVWSRELEKKEYEHGEHSFPFTLEGLDAGQFPDGVLTVEHSPYKVRIVTSSKVRPQSPCAWTYGQVLIHDVQLELGNKECLPADGAATGGIKPGSHRDLHGTFSGSIPAEGSSQKVELLGNLFKTGGGEMYDNTGFTTHKTQWGDGPLIPVFAKLRLRSSDDTPTEAPLGLGNVKCLWDWEDVAENTGALAAPPAAYISKSANFHKNTTKPKGDNCHSERGGKRNATGAADFVFPAEAGYDPVQPLTDASFPFKVEPAATRKWASFSSPWRKESLAGKTGVLFRPSRIAGDRYKITCHVAWDKDETGKAILDTEDPLDDKTTVFVKSGEFVIWRRHTINRYVKKKGFAMNIPVAEVQAYYEKGFIALANDYGAADFMDAATYNTAMSGYVAGLNSTRRPMVDPVVNQHANGDHCITFRDYNAYLAALRAAMGWTQAELNTWLAGPGAIFNTAAKYERVCDSVGMSALVEVCAPFMPAKNGVSLCQFIGVHNIGGLGRLNGYAADLPGATRQKAAFITCATPGAYSGNANTLSQTTTHEIGHHLFMPHAPDGVSAGGGPAPDMHDQADHNCTMSYNFAAERRWCGFCLLRLRGWDRTKLTNDANNNTA